MPWCLQRAATRKTLISVLSLHPPDVSSETFNSGNLTAFQFFACIFFLTTKAMLLAAVRPSDQPYFRLAFRSFPCLCSFHFDFLKKPKTVQKSTIENHQTSNTPLDLPRGFSSCTHRGATPFQFVPQDLLNLRAWKMQDLHEKKIVLVGSTPYSKILEDLRGQNLFLINYFKRFL